MSDNPHPESNSQAATLRKQAVRGGAIVLVARFTAQVFQWSVTLFVARLLLPDDYGMMTSGLLLLGLADLFAEAGIGKALVQKEALTPEDLAQGFTLSLVLSASLYLVLFLLADPVGDYLERADFARFLRVLALALMLTPWRSIAGAVLERELHLGRSSAVQLSAAVLQAAIVLGLAWAEFGYWALAAGALVGRVSETALMGFVAGWRPQLALPSRAATGLIRYGVHLSAGSLLWFIYSNADFAVLGMLLGPIYLGYYTLAFQMISLPVQKMSTSANQVMFAVYCRLQDDRARLRDWFLRLTVLQSFLALPALAGLALVAEDGIPLLLGDQWRSAVLPLQLLCPIGALMMVTAALLPLLNAIGRPDINLRYTATCAAVFPAGFFVGGWWGQQIGDEKGGVVGVCLVWLIFYPLVVTGLIFLTRRLTEVTPAQLLRAHVPVLAGVVVLMVSVLATQRMLHEANAGVRLLVGTGVGVVSYSLWILASARGTILVDLGLVWQELRGRRPTPDAEGAAKDGPN